MFRYWQFFTSKNTISVLHIFVSIMVEEELKASLPESALRHLVRLSL
jgi:hypothetical protein